MKIQFYINTKKTNFSQKSLSSLNNPNISLSQINQNTSKEKGNISKYHQHQKSIVIIFILLIIFTIQQPIQTNPRSYTKITHHSVPRILKISWLLSKISGHCKSSSHINRQNTKNT